MTISKFEEFSKKTKYMFSVMLRKEGVTNESYKAFFKSIIDECESNFELETITEILKEEFQDYLTSFQKEEIGA